MGSLNAPPVRYSYAKPYRSLEYRTRNAVRELRIEALQRLREVPACELSGRAGLGHRSAARGRVDAEDLPVSPTSTAVARWADCPSEKRRASSGNEGLRGPAGG